MHLQKYSEIRRNESSKTNRKSDYVHYNQHLHIVDSTEVVKGAIVSEGDEGERESCSEVFFDGFFR